MNGQHHVGARSARQRQVDARPHRPLEPVVLHVAGDADHCHPWPVVSRPDTATNTIRAFAPERADEGFIHDNDFRGPLDPIAVFEKSALSASL